MKLKKGLETGNVGTLGLGRSFKNNDDLAERKPHQKQDQQYNVVLKHNEP